MKHARSHSGIAFAGSAFALILLVSACGSSDSAGSATVASDAPQPAVTADATATLSAVTEDSVPATSASTEVTSVATSGDVAIVNTWSSAVIDPTKLPIGDSMVSTSGAAIGALFACSAGNPNAGGASKDGPWLDVAAGTWDSTTKLAVEGEVSWGQAEYSETLDAVNRTLTSNDLPVDGQTGVFPIASSDPSYEYDQNPGTIQEQAITRVLTATPAVAATPTCLPEGPVAILKNGVQVFSSLDGRGDDAVAHESQDLCQGHPAMTTYHYHNIPSCIRDATVGSSTVVGFALDGFPIVVERDANDALATNADLDQCHGRTSDIVVDGETVNMYHYSATLEFPYFIGCYAGTPISAR